MRAGTIVASNYVEMAKVLGESFLRHHPDSTFVILVIDDGPIGDPSPGIEFQRIDDLDLTAPELDLMRTVYDVMEFSTAVKPSFLRGLLRSDDIACYLDPDIFVYAAFDDVVAPATDHGIVLTPHVLAPIPRDDCDPKEMTIMTSGIFNLGFIAVTVRAADFLDWWQTRLLLDAVVEIDQGLFTDQRWVDWVPGLFSHHRADDPGMNIAWWNIHERDLDATDIAAPTVTGRPVRFVHFSGYDPLTPDTLSKHQFPKPRTAHAPGIPIRRLAEAYGDRLIDAGHVEKRSAPYTWGTTDDGLVLNAFIRRLVRRAALAEHRSGVAAADMKTPFAFGERAAEFRPWLEATDGGTPDFPVSRLEREVWSARPDLRFAFPDIDGDDALAYREWLRHEPQAAAATAGVTPALPYEERRQEVDEAALTPYRRVRRAVGRLVRAVEARWRGR